MNAPDAMDAISRQPFKIPGRSPDLNPIENVFHLEGNQLHKDAIKENISKETFQKFCWHIKEFIEFYPSYHIKDNRVYEQMCDAIITSKGERIIKY